MSRERYGPWLDGVDDRTMSTALCAAGLAATYVPELLRVRELEPSEAATRIAGAWRAVDGGGPARWTDPASVPGWDPAAATQASVLARTWGYLFGQLGSYPPRLSVDPGIAPDMLAWVAGQLAYEANAAPFVPLPPGGPVPRPWPLPLRVGVLAGPAGATMRAEVRRARLRGSDWRRQLLNPVEVGRERATCDLLILSGDPAAALAALSALREVHTQVVLVLGGAGTMTAGPGVVAELVAATGAWAVGLAEPADAGGRVIEFCRQLTHNLTAEEAFLRSGEVGPFFARPDVLVVQRLIRRAAAAASALAAAEPREVRGEEVRGPERQPDAVRVALATAFAGRLELDRIMREGRFEFESDEATQIDTIMRATAAVIDYTDARRYVRAAVTAADDPGTALAAFRPGTTHTVRVDIGSPAPFLLLAVTPIDQGEAPAPQRLTVVLTEPTLLPVPLADEIDLPVTGPSTAAEFTLVTRPDTVEVDARIIVLSGNRVLQTARLPREVVTGGVRDDEVAGSVATPEIMIAPITEELAERRTFDIALVVDGAAAERDGGVAATTGTVVAGTATASIRLGDQTVVEAAELISARLSAIVDAPEDFGSLDSPASVALLTKLAGHGWLMGDALVQDTAGMGDVLARSKYVQVTSAVADTWFPFEFAYDFPAPDMGAPLCPDAAAALAAGGVETTCPADHDGSTVCPFGFWGVNRVIERHVSPPSGPVAHPEFLMNSGTGRYRDRIVLGSALMAASGRVDRKVPGSIGRVADALNRHSRSRHVDDWDQWRQEVAADPALLMLLPHTVYDPASELYGLEIGTEARLTSSRINKTVMPAVPSIAVLLGCDTSRAGPLRYERFPALLRRAGAKVVIATLTEIYGRHAAPMAESFTDELFAACHDEPVGVGEVMVILRRRMLARGIPAVLALIAFGDADWSITQELP